MYIESVTSSLLITQFQNLAADDIINSSLDAFQLRETVVFVQRMNCPKLLNSTVLASQHSTITLISQA